MTKKKELFVCGLSGTRGEFNPEIIFTKELDAKEWKKNKPYVGIGNYWAIKTVE